MCVATEVCTSSTVQSVTLEEITILTWAKLVPSAARTTDSARLKSAWVWSLASSTASRKKKPSSELRRHVSKDGSASLDWFRWHEKYWIPEQGDQEYESECPCRHGALDEGLVQTPDLGQSGKRLSGYPSSDDRRGDNAD